MCIILVLLVLLLVVLLVSGVVIYVQVVMVVDCSSCLVVILVSLCEGCFVDVICDFDLIMCLGLLVSKLQVVWVQVLLVQVGVFEDIGILQVQMIVGKVMVEMLLYFVWVMLLMWVVCDKDGQVVVLFFVLVLVGEDFVVVSLFLFGVCEQLLVVCLLFGLLLGMFMLFLGDGLFLVVLLVVGFGFNDCDEMIGLNKFFCDLVVGLVKVGIVLLCYDKCIFIYGRQLVIILFMVDDEVIDDVLIVFVLFCQQLYIDCQYVFVIGYSFGVLMVLWIVQCDGYLVGVILFVVLECLDLGVVLQ